MSRYLNYGDTAVRPGNYFSYDKKGNNAAAGASDGVTAVLFQAKWGPLNTPVIRTADEGYADVFGNEGNTDIIDLTYEGGTREAVLVRVGTGGTKATVTLTNNADEPVNAVTITAKYVGSRTFSVTVRDSISDSNVRECIIYDGTTEFEKVQFAASTNAEPASLVAAFANSENFDAALASSSVTGKIETVAQKGFTAGTDPTVSAAEYSAGFNKLDQYEQNCVIVDTSDYTIIALLNTYVWRMFNSGKNVIAVCGEPNTVALETREGHAAACNAENVVYVLNGNLDHAIYGTIDGHRTAAKVAGMIAGTSCKYSLTHTVLSNVTGLNELLTEAQISEAELSGCLVLTLNTSRQIWIDAAINTLVTPAGNQDNGWKKIRRTKTRFELLTRANAAVDDMIGKVDNDNAGRIAIKDAIMTVGIAMIGEGKLQYLNVTDDSSHQAEGDSCWFTIDVIDKDSAEHIYLRYLFRYSTQAISENV